MNPNWLAHYGPPFPRRNRLNTKAPPVTKTIPAANSIRNAEKEVTFSFGNSASEQRNKPDSKITTPNAKTMIFSMSCSMNISRLSAKLLFTFAHTVTAGAIVCDVQAVIVGIKIICRVIYRSALEMVMQRFFP